MSSHNPYKPSWQYSGHDQGRSNQRGGSQGQGREQAQGSSVGTQAQGGMPGIGKFQGDPSPFRDPNFHGYNSTQAYSNSYYPNSSYDVPSTDMQYMIQMMISLGHQLDQLSHLIAQNNQLLQSMHDQEDTKCIQGSGGGAIIVRM
ncbi:hypothetical protein [Pseudalkalibacillus decolorationis]|uniref:hypothetical protein n=1 Tax=Pseudalkalibacillus decolorationis TaxID=163879 RepID=UPI002148D07C|nr:hypothetical protein [Pseudalkalibacillus decolorationis]